MTGICIELKTECKFCGNPMPINALVEEVQCHSCQKIQNFSFDFWKNSILDSAIKDGIKFNEGEGQNQTIMTGEFTFHLMYGKQHARCSKCKTPLDENKLEDFAKSGKSICEKCKNEVSVRAVPENLKQIFPGLKYLAGEDSDLFNNTGSAQLSTQSSKPIIFKCPSCAGALEIDGKERMVTCKFCSSEIYLPDDLWLRLHPAKTVNRWYLVYDDTFIKEKLITWYDFSDCTIDANGNVYMFTKGDDDDDCTAWSFDIKMKTRWSVVMKNMDDDETRLTIGRDGSLYIYDKSKQDLYKLSPANGTTLKVIKGHDSAENEHVSFDIKQCDSLAVDSDGSIIGLIENYILRFDNDGKNIPMWEAGSHGIFSKLSSMFKEESSDPDVGKLKNKPITINSYSTIVSFDWDGNIYFLDSDSGEDASLAMYDRSGNKVFNTIIPLYQKTSKPGFDRNGNVYVLGKDENDIISLVRYSRNKNSWETIIMDVARGGYLSNEEKLAVAPDGTIYAMNYNNRLKIFNANLNMIYISEKSKEDDTEKKAKQAQK